jgi:Family of unknown function (DUF5723)
VKKIFTILLITCYSFATNAQIANIFADEFKDGLITHIGIVGDYDINSNAITNQFTQKFYTGGYINEELKNLVLSRIKNENRIGGNINSGIFAAFKSDPYGKYKNISLFFSVRDRSHFDAQFSKDLFKIGFYGNADYAGKTANLSHFNLNLIRYQQLQIGVYSKSDSAAHWGIGVSFLKGEQYLSIAAKKAELFTSIDGQFININTDFSIARSDTAHTGMAAFNGYGASLEIFFEAPFQTRFGASKIASSISDLGAIRFNKQSQLAQQDSMLHYQGFQINNLFDLRDSAIFKREKDSVKNMVTPFKKKAFAVTLPAVFDLSLETKLNRYFSLKEGIRYVFNANNKMLVYVKGYFYIHPKWILSTTFGYGGYGTFNFGISTSVKLPKKFIIRAGSNNLEGFIVPKKTTGQGAYFTLIKQF